MTTGETYFFRDKGQFSLIRHTILPELVERNKEKKSLRIWSAGCSTGEEAYSIAILIDELVKNPPIPPLSKGGERGLDGWDILILGTDINEEGIKKARDGYYGEWSFRQAGGEIKERYFKKEKNRWLLNERIRNMARFEVMNLITDRYPCRDAACGVSALHDMDLILCRNVFIYFNPDIVHKVASKMVDTLNDGGYLITGHAELKTQEIQRLKTMVFPESVVFQKSSEVEKEYRIQEPEVRIPKPTLPLKGQGEGGFNSELRVPHSAFEEARALADRGRYDEAVKYCKEAIKAEPFNAVPYYLLAQIARENGDKGAEMEMLKRVIYLNPSHIAAFLEMGIIYEGEGDMERATKMRKTALGLLRALPADAHVEPYTFTAGELIEHVKKLI